MSWDWVLDLGFIGFINIHFLPLPIACGSDPR